MVDSNSIDKKKKSLESAISRYNEYKLYVDEYKTTKKLDLYVEHINSISADFSDGLLEYYENMIRLYKEGNDRQLLSNLYDRLLAADDYKNKVAEELKQLLRTE